MNCNYSTLKASLLTLVTICISTFLHANKPNHYPHIDDELGKLLVEGMSGLMNDFPDDPDYPTFSDEHYRARFLELSGEIQYRLNADIKNHIIHRTERYRSATERTLGLSEMYFPIFEEYLAQKDIPHHIKYLPIVESNLNAVAKSHAAAVGLWQFIPETGRLYKLTVASHLDERSDTHKASEAAATMLSFLFKRYGDWGLALAAYNCGPGRVDKYVKGTEGKTFWDIRSYLPKETQMYVPYFMAVAYSYEFYELHELKPVKLPSDLVLTDSIHLEPGYVTLSELSRKYEISRDTLNRLNPGYIKGYAPSGSRTNILVLPARIVAKLRGYEDSYNEIMSMRTENPIKCIRRINTEEDLALLMKAHRFTRQDLLFWNGLPSNYKVKKGDVVAVRKYYVPKDAWIKEETKKNIESISIASLKVVGLDDNKKKALTAPVYISVKGTKLSDNVSTTALTPATSSVNNDKDNLYKLKNTTTALPAQKVQEPEILTEVSENRDRSRRLRTSEPIVSTPVPSTTEYQKPQLLAASNTSAEENKQKEEEARHKAAIEEANRKAAIEAAQQAKLEAATVQATLDAEAIQAKEQAVVKAKVYEKTSTEEMAALTQIQEATKELKEERLSNQQTTAQQKAQEQVYNYHTVQNNETIWEIAKQYPNTSAQEIMTLNNIKAETILRTGTVLKIRAK